MNDCDGGYNGELLESFEEFWIGFQKGENRMEGIRDFALGTKVIEKV
jgi:hypothetical protein